MTTNLLPKEIVKDRFIRSKKPWAIAAAALLLLGCTISYASLASALGTVAEDHFKSAESQLTQVTSRSSDLKSKESTAQGEFESVDEVGKHLIGNVDNRILWLELFRAINECLPSDPQGKRPKEIAERNELHVTSIDCQQVPSLDNWLARTAQFYRPPPGKEKPKSEAGAADPMADPMAGAADPMAAMGGGATPGMDPMGGGAAMGGLDPMSAMGGAGTGPAEEYWIVTIQGYHFHNPERAVRDMGAQFVQDTLVTNLNTIKVLLPTADKEAVEKGEKKPLELVSLEDLGISHAVQLSSGRPWETYLIDRSASEEPTGNGGAGGAGMPGGIGTGGMPGGIGAGGMPGGIGAGGMPGGMGAGGMPGMVQGKPIKVRGFTFLVQFAWKPTPPTERLKKQEEAEKAQEGAGPLDAAQPLP